ncbi:phage major capsid protein, partial [Megasphaera sp.]|uniref:phage major capsid protein n=1 Tax=Megasphaera sp. TaxID=2023260 RepID=UPI0040257519
MDYAKMLADAEKRMQALMEQTEKTEEVNELRSIYREMQTLRSNIEILKAAKADQEGRDAHVEDAKPAEPAPAAPVVDDRTTAVNQEAEKRADVPAGTFAVKAGKDKREQEAHAEMEQRGADLKQRGTVVRFAADGLFPHEKRSILTTTPTIIVPTFDSPVINDGFNTVSSLVDRVKHVNLNGGESYEEPYRIDIPDGSYTAEGAAASDTDVTFGKAAMTKSKITAYSEISREMLKLPNADYAGYVQGAIRTSIRAKMTKEILLGSGATNSFVGLFSTKATAIDPATDLTLTGIDDTTLDQIIFSYGGKEDVEDAAVLILNKLDLLAFASVRTSTKQKFYDIKSQANTGTINGLPY